MWGSLTSSMCWFRSDLSFYFFSLVVPFSPQGVQATTWATVLALVWLHQYKWKVPWSELLEAKARRWLQNQPGNKILLGGVML